MQNELKSPKPARSSSRAGVGATVNAGEVLVVVDKGEEEREVER